MQVLRIAALCVAAALMTLTLRAERPEIARVVAICAGVAAVILSMDAIGDVVSQLAALTQTVALDGGSLGLMLRALGVSVIGEFASGMCRDAGESALAARVEFGSRVALLAMGAPLMVELVNQLMQCIGA